MTEQIKPCRWCEGQDKVCVNADCPLCAEYTTKVEFGIDADGNPLCMVYHENVTEPDIYDVIRLPEGHGRLIDADALAAKYTEEIKKLEEWAKIQEKEGRLDMFRACHLRAAYLAEAKLNIEATPTILPAEGGNEDG